MAEVWAFIADIYKSPNTRTQVSNLRLSQFEPSDGSPYPKLKGKAAEAKDLVELVLAAWEHFRNDDTYEYEQVRRMLASQLEAQNVISEYGSDIFCRLVELACISNPFWIFCKATVSWRTKLIAMAIVSGL